VKHHVKEEQNELFPMVRKSEIDLEELGEQLEQRKTELMGGEMAPPLAGGEFLAGWDGLTVGDLFERIRISMPQNAPGSLSGQQNADILSYMLSVSKFPAGTAEMPKEAGILKQIKFEVKKP